MGKACSNCNCLSLEPHEFSSAPVYKESLHCDPLSAAGKAKTDPKPPKASIVEVRVWKKW